MHPFFRKFFSVCLILALATVGAMQGRRAFKNARAKRLTTEAALHLKLNEFQEASRCLHAALQAEPSSVEATKLTGDLLEAAGSPAAISWRVRASELQPVNMTNRLDWAQTAVKLRDPKSAEDALSGLDDDAKSTGRYHKIAGALAWSQGKTEEAEQHYEQARKLEPENPSNLLNLGTIGLVSTNVELAAAARLSLQSLAATNGPYALDALRRLAQEASKGKNLIEAIGYTRRVATNSAATFADKLDYLNLLTGARDSDDARAWLTLLKQNATNSPAEVFALGRWLSRNNSPTNALDWLSSLPQSVQTNQPVPLVITDCQITVKDWPALLATVEKKDWGEAETLRLALESLAHRSLGQEEIAQTLWKRARRQSARRLDRLYRLTQLTSAWDWGAERTEVLTEIVSEFPREKWAVQLLVTQLHDAGATQELEQLFSKLSAADPANLELKASLARICFLRKTKLPAAHRLAKEAFDGAPNNPLVLSTYAYSLLLQGSQEEALRLLEDLKPPDLQIPWVAACYGVIEAQSGNKSAAREPLKRAQAAKLLPEEMEMVRLAVAAAN
jgi:predicted Zn-dependent protease